MRKSMHDSIVEALKEADLLVVASDTKISRHTLKKIRYREIENPGVRWMDVLDNYFFFVRRRRRAG